MSTQDELNYSRIAKAITFIQAQYKQQPSLEEIAAHVQLSPFHFQRLFSDWAGTTPKKFLQYISLAHAKNLLTEKQATLFDTAFETGLSSTSRLHDLFVQIEGMTPAEYQQGGKDLSILYNFYFSPFGKILIASTPKGICSMVFEENEEQAILQLYAQFPNAIFVQQEDIMHQNALAIFQHNDHALTTIKLHLKGTAFQLKVWEALLKIPTGALSTYGKLAGEIGNSKASRAVGTAIGSNPVAFLIPCHRVIQSTGHIGGYMWGNVRKTAIIAWESAQNEP